MIGKKPQLPQVESVVLKPRFGMRPGMYILLTYIALALLVFIALCLLPGLFSNTSYVTFNEEVAFSGVLEDGKYLGAASGTDYRTTSGRHTYTFIVEGLPYGEVTVDVKRHYFFTFFTHRPQLVECGERAFSREIRERLTSSFISEVALYSAVTDAPSSFHYPPLYSGYARNAVLTGMSDITDVWLFASAFVTSDALYADWKAASAILSGSPVRYESEEYKEIAGEIEKVFNSSPSSSAISSSALPSIIPEKNGALFTYPATTFVMGSGTSLTFPALTENEVEVTTPLFHMEATLVTESQYAAFVSENPYWSRDNIERLISDGMVDDNYLRGITLSKYTPSVKPIRNISWHAASAYCDWLSSKTGESWSLPTEAEWTLAALSAADKEYVTSLVWLEGSSDTPSSLMGQLWEFTSTPFIPLSRLNGASRLSSSPYSYLVPDVVVKGGSFVSDPSSVTPSTVGTAEKSRCSEWTGFRVVKHG